MEEYRVPALFTLGTAIVACALIALTLYPRKVGLSLDKWAARRSPLTKAGRDVIIGSIGDFSAVTLLPFLALQAISAPVILQLQVFMAMGVVSAPFFYFRIKGEIARGPLFKKRRAAKCKDPASARRT